MSGTIPDNTVASNGIGVIADSQANTWVKGGEFLATLRAFGSALSGMTCYMLGYTTAGDGGQGSFYWNPSSTTTDDGGATTIQPNGITFGRWLRLSGTGQGYSVSTIAALRLATTTTLPATLVNVIQYQAGYPSGGGNFLYVASDTSSSDNGGTIIVDASGRRWYRQTYGDALDILWFGGNVALADNTTALNAAIAAIPSGGGEVMFGPGRYTFLSTITATYPAGQYSITFAGGGADATILYWPTGNGLSCVCSSAQHSVHMRDLTIATGTAYSSNSIGVQASNSIQGGIFAQSDFVRVTFRGIDGGDVYQWGTGLLITGLCNVSYSQCLFRGLNTPAGGGSGLSVVGEPSGSFKYSIVHNISGCGFFNLGTGFTFGTYVQGVTINQCNFTGGTTGILVPSAATGCDQLTVTDNQFNGMGSALLVGSGITNLMFSDNLLFVPAIGNGIAINASWSGCTVIGNAIGGPTSSNGININAAGSANVITGNSFTGLDTGILLQAAATNCNVQSNVYANCLNTVVNSGSGNTIGGGSE